MRNAPCQALFRSRRKHKGHQGYAPMAYHNPSAPPCRVLERFLNLLTQVGILPVGPALLIQLAPRQREQLLHFRPGFPTPDMLLLASKRLCNITGTAGYYISILA